MNHVIEEWSRKAVSRQFEFVVVLDLDKAKANIEAKHTPYTRLFIQSIPPYNCVRGWNLAASMAIGKVLILVADDIVPPNGWDEQLFSLSPRNWTEGEYMVHVDDGNLANRCTHPIITRRRYERFGYFFYPHYESMYCDTELTQAAYQDEVVIDARHILFEHVHPALHKRELDSTDRANSSKSRYQSGRRLFRTRKKNGFPIDAGPRGEFNWAASVLVTRNRSSLFDICKRLREQGVLNFLFSVPSKHLVEAPAQPIDIEAVGIVAERLEASGAKTYIKEIHVPMSSTGSLTSEAETLIRNKALDWIRSEGFYDILIVDDEELWESNALALLENFVRRDYLAVSATATPRTKFPGTHSGNPDTALLYLGGNIKIKHRRDSTVPPLNILNRLYHASSNS